MALVATAARPPTAGTLQNGAIVCNGLSGAQQKSAGLPPDHWVKRRGRRFETGPETNQQHSVTQCPAYRFVRTSNAPTSLQAAVNAGRGDRAQFPKAGTPTKPQRFNQADGAPGTVIAKGFGMPVGSHPRKWCRERLSVNELNSQSGTGTYCACVPKAIACRGFCTG